MVVEVEQRRERRVFEGVVCGGKDKTIAVQVERRVSHPNFRKYVGKSTKFLAHNIGHDCKIGDLVQIKESRPYSKLKRFTLVAVLKRAVVA